ncbi:MAG TPA: LysR substrate-binding domain-containing protein [Microvirga sp.]|jgi:LysR family hydrogen peroxide-inducible transcriptional activator
MVTLRQLRYFAALAQTAHFGRAAERCSVTQPALSMQVKELERELGLTLVERSGSGASLTPDGQEVARRAASILAEAGELAAYARQRQGVLVGPFRLGIIPSVAPYILPGLLGAARERFPSLNLLVREAQTEALLGEVARGELDAALLSIPAGDHAVETLPLFEDPFFIAVEAAAEASWAAEADPAERLRREPLLLLDEGHCLRDQALQFCRLGNAAERRTLGATSLTTILHMVAAGHGVTLLPALCAGPEVDRRRVALIRFPDEAPKRTIALAWRAGASRREELVTLGGLIRDMAAPARLEAASAPRATRTGALA